MGLSESQGEAMSLFKKGRNLFISGPAGTGKSYLIDVIFNNAHKKVQVCATTGCAASLLQKVQAKTIHAWSGMGIGVGSTQDVISRIKTNKKIVTHWKSTDVLIIDEVSMLSAKTINLLDDIARSIRKTDLPFGGIQVVLVGDFYQLPPIGNPRDPLTSAFCFESERWGSLIDDVIELSTCFRHVDSLYAKIMNEIRVGVLSKTSNEILKSKVNKTTEHDHCIIYPNRYQVNKVNEYRLRQLDETTRHVYKPMCLDPFPLSRYEPVELRVGARVMCTANIDTSGTNYIVNGSPGKVISFKDGYPVVVFKNGAMRVMTRHEFPTDIDDVYVRHIPLMLAWAITIHKSQGITLESAEVDAGSGIFECGQTYVALSRLKTLDGLHLSAYDVRKVKVNRKVKQFYGSLGAS